MQTTTKTLIGTVTTTFLLLLIAPPVAAGDEFDCQGEISCDVPIGECAIAADWGTLYGSVTTTHNLNPSPTGTPSASVAPVGNDPMERWIITTCSSISFRAYASFSTAADTEFCLEGEGEPGRPNCASWATGHVIVNGDAGESDGSWCGVDTCSYADAGSVEKKVTSIDINQPGGTNIPVAGVAHAEYREDQDGDGLWENEDPHTYKTVTATVTFRTGSTPF